MRTRIRRRHVRTMVAAVWVITALAAPAGAESRRALLVGIDEYVPAVAAPPPRPPGAVASSTPIGSRPRGSWSNLDGAVNDVEELRQILIARYGFKPDEIRVLRNAEATRTRVLSETKDWLAGGRSGDVRLFVYAGHGSQVRNSRSEEVDKLDESIVPADANSGVPDIRDKELAALFNVAIDNGVLLTVIFDSCHSGSIARGAPRLTRFRYLLPDERDVADPSRPQPPETRDALVLSAAQDYQLAAETRDEQNRPHGLFSWALLKTLRSMPVNQSAERMFLQVRALMQSGDVLQEPVLATTDKRRRLPLFGTGTAGAGETVVAVQQVDADGSVVLQGGISAGIRKDSELRRVGQPGETALRLRVVDELDLGRSRAVAAAGGDTKQLQPGVLFEVVRWAAAAGPALRVWVGASTATLADLQRESPTLSRFASVPELSIVDDPTAATSGTNLLRWTNGEWQLVSQGLPPRSVGRAPTPAAVVPLLSNTVAGNRLMVTVPLPAEVASKMQIGAGTENDTIEIVSSPDHADYLLVGRMAGNAFEYAWVRPLATSEQAQASALPARTDWLPLNSSAPDALASRLREMALRLAVLRGWLQLEPPADSGRFPYHLAIRNTSTRETRTSGPTVDGETYDLLLVLDEAMAQVVLEPRFVYVFAIDSAGSSTLLFPSSAAGAVENRLPRAISDSGELAKELRLSGFKVGRPFGVDTFILLTSATQLADPTVLQGEAVRQVEQSTRGALDPLTRLLAQKRSRQRGAAVTTPPTWSVERLSILSVPARGR